MSIPKIDDTFDVFVYGALGIDCISSQRAIYYFNGFCGHDAGQVYDRCSLFFVSVFGAQGVWLRHSIVFKEFVWLCLEGTTYMVSQKYGDNQSAVIAHLTHMLIQLQPWGLRAQLFKCIHFVSPCTIMRNNSCLYPWFVFHFYWTNPVFSLPPKTNN